MNMQSTFEKDIRSVKTASGAYEWWYFDAASDDGTTECVIIFYEGNPFSRRYIEQQQTAEPAGFPAVSISVYHQEKPIYYSFTEFHKHNASFTEGVPALQIGGHRMEGGQEGETLLFSLTLSETLPSGDYIDAELQFTGKAVPRGLITLPAGATNHHWDIIMPRARVTGSLRCSSLSGTPCDIRFRGQGYHDHNIGSEPLKDQFTEWYWGRFHFENKTFIYYITGKEGRAGKGWLINEQGRQVETVFHAVHLNDYGRSIFVLKTARKLSFEGEDAQVLVQQEGLLDNGPFYQRFSSHAYCYDGGPQPVMATRGVSEYLRPPRIHTRLFWPLTNMRIRYKKETPHWVQRSKRLYRWTW